MFLRTFTRITAVSALVASGAALVAGQQAAPAAPVFTAQQATAGKAAYAQSCASCHMPDLSGSNEMSALAGSPFMAAWGDRSTKELFDYISTAMPYGAPALKTAAYESIVAYILQFNGAAAGPSALSVATDVPIRSVTAGRGRAVPAP